jgi:hypothetical protein
VTNQSISYVCRSGRHVSQLIIDLIMLQSLKTSHGRRGRRFGSCVRVQDLEKVLKPKQDLWNKVDERMNLLRGALDASVCEIGAFTIIEMIMSRLGVGL